MQETQEMQVQPLGQEDTLEEGMAVFLYSCVENPMYRGDWGATVYRVAKSQTRLSTAQHKWSVGINIFLITPLKDFSVKFFMSILKTDVHYIYSTSLLTLQFTT